MTRSILKNPVLSTPFFKFFQPDDRNCHKKFKKTGIYKRGKMRYSKTHEI